MRLVLISDTHNQRPDLPNGDLLIHAGDVTLRGTLVEAVENIHWLSSLLPKYKEGIILVPGNHDWLFESHPHVAQDLCRKRGITLLNNKAIIINSLKLYGSPYTPFFHNWAFNVVGSAINDIWQDIPRDTDILVTHGPPLGLGDLCRNGHVGCPWLIYNIKCLPNLKLNVFGHIHEGYGHYYYNNKLFINASSLDGYYNGYNPPYIVDVANGQATLVTHDVGL